MVCKNPPILQHDSVFKIIPGTVNLEINIKTMSYTEIEENNYPFRLWVTGGGFYKV